jgi:hypothetical protein
MNKEEIMGYLEDLKKMVTKREETPYSPFLDDILAGSEGITVLLTCKSIEVTVPWVKSVGETCIILADVNEEVEEGQDWRKIGYITEQTILPLEEITSISFEY